MSILCSAVAYDLFHCDNIIVVKSTFCPGDTSSGEGMYMTFNWSYGTSVSQVHLCMSIVECKSVDISYHTSHIYFLLPPISKKDVMSASRGSIVHMKSSQVTTVPNHFETV